MKHHLCIIADSSCRASFSSRIKILSIIVYLFTLVFTVGCASVVYRVDPNSPPKMGVKEANDAIQLALSHREKYRGLSNISFDGTSFQSRGSTSGRIYFTQHFSNVSQEIMQQGNYFTVNIGFQVSLSWKSEEDARLFVDALHSLKRAQLDKDGVEQKSP